LHDKELFEQPDIIHMGECPLCCLPLSLYPEKSTLMGCCCKIICDGCNYANWRREREAGLEHRCAFCREPAPNSDEESEKQVMERVKKNDLNAMIHMGKKHHREGDFGKAFENYTKVAESGDAEAHACLGTLYLKGDGVEKDMNKAVYHFEQAAMGGDPGARSLLANYDMKNGRLERAAKHYIIAANLGHDNSLKLIKHLFVKGIVSKEDYAAALRGHQAAVDATKSAEREAAEAFRKAREADRRN
jgi:TPR repeat protein